MGFFTDISLKKAQFHDNTAKTGQNLKDENIMPQVFNTGWD